MRLSSSRPWPDFRKRSRFMASPRVGGVLMEGVCTQNHSVMSVMAILQQLLPST